MNILYVSQWLSPIGGGGETVFYDLAHGMVKYGHQVDVVSQYHSRIKDNPSDDNLRIKRVKPILHGPPPPSQRQNLGYILNAILTASHVIRSRRIDLIHANNLSSAVVGSFLSRIFSLPLIITIHVVFVSNTNFWKEWAGQPNVSRITSVIAPMVEKFTIRTHADAIHTVSNSTKADLVNFGATSKIKVIYNGIDLTKYDGLGTKNDYQDYVLYIGRLAFNKNLEVVISSFCKVREYLPHAKLVIVGDGPMKGRWQEMVARLDLRSNIQFMGYISQKEKMELLSKCCALLLPSYSEGLPIVSLEALAMRKPVLVAGIRGSHEVIDEGIEGYILPPHNPIEWSEKLIQVLSNKAMCIAMGQRGRLKVERRFNLTKMLEEMESLYKEVLNK